MKHETKPNELEHDALKKVFESYLDHDIYDLDSLASWCQRSSSNPLRVTFKQQLSAAIEHSGLLSPQIFESWTNVSIDGQAEMQSLLKSIWNECFPREAIP